jgi:hypothetical protein
VHALCSDADEGVDEAGDEEDGAGDGPAGGDLRVEGELAVGEGGFVFLVFWQEYLPIKITYR